MREFLGFGRLLAESLAAEVLFLKEYFFDEGYCESSSYFPSFKFE